MMMKKKISSRQLMKFSIICIFVLLLFFHINNFIKYDPKWGYDASAHISIIQEISHTNHWPTDNRYGTSNPPLYYFIAAYLYKYSHNIKLVQLFSLFLFALNIFLFYKCINLLSHHTLLKLALVVFFALLPVHLYVPYMINNYSLAHTLAFLSLYTLIALSKHSRITVINVIVLGGITVLAILASLTNLFLVIVVLAFLCLFPYRLFLPFQQWLQRIRNMVVFISVLLVLMIPYYSFKIQHFGCFFCTSHWQPSPVKLTQFYKVYPTRWYVNFNLKSLNYPDDSYDEKEGLWISLHKTLYGDYQTYLVDGKTHENVKVNSDSDPLGRVKSGRHYYDQRRIKNLRILHYMGLSISLVFMVIMCLNFKNMLHFFHNKRRSFFLQTLFILTIGAVFCQFLVYIFRYPNWVNVHSGYLLPAVFSLLVSLSMIKNTKLATGTAICLTVFSIVSYLTFFMRY